MPFVVGFFAILGLWLIAFGATVYHGWVLGDRPWVVRARRRFFWHGMRAGMPYAWLVPGAVPVGLGAIAWAAAAGLVSSDAENAYGLWLGLLGFPLIFIPMFLAWRRLRWFLAPWHRSEVEREAAGLPPAMPVPESGPQMTITPRQHLFGLGLAAACVAGWWFSGLLAFLTGAFYIVALLAAMRVVERRRARSPQRPRQRNVDRQPAKRRGRKADD